MAFCRELPERCGVVAVPNQVFYADRTAGRHLVRFSFAKRPEVLEDAVARLGKLGP
jgi:N-succinyldiaminopimelate aminotransferase